MSATNKVPFNMEHILNCYGFIGVFNSCARTPVNRAHTP